MFYYDDDVAVVELGTGDTQLMGSHLASDESIGTLSIVDNCGKCHPIGTKISEDKWASATKGARFDTDLNTVVRIVFRKVESVDSLIAELQEVKAYMEKYQFEATKEQPDRRNRWEEWCGMLANMIAHPEVWSVSEISNHIKRMPGVPKEEI